MREVLSYFREQFAFRRNHPGDDITSLLAQATLKGEPLHDRTKAAMLFVLLIGGIDTTGNALNAALYHVAEHRDDRARLRQDPGRLDAAVRPGRHQQLPVDLLESGDISNAVDLLLSDQARYITGIQLAIDAGTTNKP